MPADRAGESNPAGFASPTSEPSLTESALWLLAAKVFAFAFAIALPLILTRKLSPNDFGTYKQVFLVVGTAVAVLPLNVGLSAFYFLATYPDRRGSIVANVLLFYAVIGSLAAVAFAAFPGGLAWAFNVSEGARFAPGIALLVALSVFASFLEIAPVANREFRLGSALIVGTQLTRTALLVAAALLSGSIAWLLTAAIVYTVIQTLVLWAYLARRFPRFWLQVDPSLLWQQCLYSLPFALSGVLWTVQTDLHQYLVSSQFGASAFAIYAVGCFQLPLVGLLQDSINSVLLPRFSTLAQAGATHDIFALLVSASRKLALALFPLYAFLAIFGREFLIVLFTEQYLRELAGLYHQHHHAADLGGAPWRRVPHLPGARSFLERRPHRLHPGPCSFRTPGRSLVWLAGGHRGGRHHDGNRECCKWVACGTATAIDG